MEHLAEQLFAERAWRYPGAAFEPQRRTPSSHLEVAGLHPKARMVEHIVEAVPGPCERDPARSGDDRGSPGARWDVVGRAPGGVSLRTVDVETFQEVERIGDDGPELARSKRDCRDACRVDRSHDAQRLGIDLHDMANIGGWNPERAPR